MQHNTNELKEQNDVTERMKELTTWGNKSLCEGQNCRRKFTGINKDEGIRGIRKEIRSDEMFGLFRKTRK